MLILVINSGSSSLKYQLSNTTQNNHTPLATGIIERITEPQGTHTHHNLQTNQKHTQTQPIPNHTTAIQLVNETLKTTLQNQTPQAVGHRIVHGGENFNKPTLITPQVLQTIQNLNQLAPLHNPAHILGIQAITQIWPNTPQIAVFDTAFHRTIPEKAWRYAIPNELYTKHAIRRYGFHGTSHEYVTQQTAKLMQKKPENLNAVIAHLGNGASITAIQNGKSVDTSMGLTPLEGLVMGTRSGDIDPGIIIFLNRNGYTNNEIDNLLNRESGLKGLTGESDLRTVTKLAETQTNAKIALQIFTYRIAKYIGAYHIAANGMQALTFTAGIGENSATIRQQITEQLTPLGIQLDKQKNETPNRTPRIISTPNSTIPILVIPTDEEKAIAQATENLATKL